MSDTGSLLRNIGGQIIDLGLVVHQKLDQAEQVMQFNQGQRMLSDSMNQFDLQLDQNPDWKSYPDLNTKAEDDAWKNIQDKIKNPGALNSLNEWWNGQRLARANLMTRKVIQARLDENLGLLKNNLDAAEKKGDKDTIDKLLQIAKETNIINASLADQEKEKRFHTIEYNNLASAARQIAFDKNGGENTIDSGMDYIYTTKDFPGITAEERQQIGNMLYTEYNHARLMIQERQKEQLAEIKNEGFNKILDGEWGIRNIEAIPDLGPETAATKEWLRSLLDSATDKTRKGDTPEFRSLLLEVHNNGKSLSQDEIDILDKRNDKLFSAKLSTREEYELITSMLGTKQGQREDKAEPKYVESIGAGATADTRRYFDEAQGNYLKWLGTDGRNASDQEKVRQAQLFRQSAERAAAMEAVKGLYSGQITQQLLGAKVILPIKTDKIIIDYVKALGGKEIELQAKAGNPTARSIRQMAIDDFSKRFPDMAKQQGSIVPYQGLVSGKEPIIVIQIGNEKWALILDDQNIFQWYRTTPKAAGPVAPGAQDIWSKQ